ncbi:hypothetical protein LOAG_07791, partial [Loa loa]
VLFKKVICDATIDQVSLFMNGLGLLNATLNSLPITNITRKWRRNVHLVQCTIASGFNFLINFGITLLHPLVISIGMLFGIPISAEVSLENDAAIIRISC